MFFILYLQDIFFFILQDIFVTWIMATSLPPSPMAAVTGASGEFFIIRTSGTGNIGLSQ